MILTPGWIYELLGPILPPRNHIQASRSASQHSQLPFGAAAPPILPTRPTPQQAAALHAAAAHDPLYPPQLAPGQTEPAYDDAPPTYDEAVAAANTKIRLEVDRKALDVWHTMLDPASKKAESLKPLDWDDVVYALKESGFKLYNRYWREWLILPPQSPHEPQAFILRQTPEGKKLSVTILRRYGYLFTLLLRLKFSIFKLKVVGAALQMWREMWREMWLVLSAARLRVRAWQRGLSEVECLCLGIKA